MDVLRDRRWRHVHVTAYQHRERTPDQQDPHHDRRDLHDAQRLAARLMNALDVLPPEVRRDQHTESGSEKIHGQLMFHVSHFAELIQQGSQVLPRADDADRTCEDVVKDERRNRQPRHERPHGVAHDDIHAAADEHAAAFHVDAANREAEEHDGEYEPGCGFSDRLFRDAAGIEGGRSKIAQDDGCATPERDEGERSRGRHYHFWRYRRPA